jgi:hypothetical protein
MSVTEWKAFGKFAVADLLIAWFVDERLAAGFAGVVAVIWIMRHFNTPTTVTANAGTPR